MNADVVAIVEPAVQADVNHAVLVAEAYRDAAQAERDVKTAEAKAVKAANHAAVCNEDAKQKRDVLRQKRLALGRALLAARGQWPAKGPGSGGWSAFLKRMGIEERTARRAMALAEYVGVSDSEDAESDIPTQREVAAARRREVEPDPPPQMQEDDEDESPVDDWKNEIESRRETPSPPVSARVVVKQANTALAELRGIAEHIEKGGRSQFNVSIVGIEAHVRKAIAALEELLA